MCQQISDHTPDKFSFSNNLPRICTYVNPTTFFAFARNCQVLLLKLDAQPPEENVRAELSEWVLQSTRLLLSCLLER